MNGSATLSDLSIEPFFTVVQIDACVVWVSFLRVFAEVRRVRPSQTEANTRPRTTRDDAWLPPLLLQKYLRYPLCHPRSAEHAGLTRLWLRSTAGRGTRSIAFLLTGRHY